MGNTSIGALTVGTATHTYISEPELLLLEELARQMSLALQALPTEGTARDLSPVDPLTHLSKREFFREHLEHRLRQLIAQDATPTVIYRSISAARGIFAGVRLFDEVGSDRTTRARPRSVISAPGRVAGAGQSCNTAPANKAVNSGVDNPKLVVRTVGRRAEAILKAAVGNAVDSAPSNTRIPTSRTVTAGYVWDPKIPTSAAPAIAPTRHAIAATHTGSGGMSDAAMRRSWVA
jgi:hypothetical protein